jgi:hypothetical protein
MFGWLKRRSRVPYETEVQVWATRAAKIRGVCETIRGVTTVRKTMLVYHFDETWSELRPILDAAGIQWKLAEDNPAAALIDPTTPLIVCPSSRLPALDAPAERDDSRYFSILVVEAYPVRSGDERVEIFAEGLPRRSKIVYACALDELPLSIFAGEKLNTVLRALGMKDDEPLNDRRIATSVRRAQQKIEQKATADQPSATAREWFELNLPN